MLRLIAVILPVCASALAQPAPAPPAFEVASVKIHDGPRSTICGFSSSGPRATWQVCNVYGLIREAYSLKSYQITFASSVQRPDEDTDYDIFAKAEGDAPITRSQFRQMLQTLLAERFNLRAHPEKKEMPVYALVIGKGGPKFKESTADEEFSGFGGVNGRNQYMKCTKADMENLAFTIPNIFFVDRPVVDRTGLKGYYDWRIEATPEPRINNNPDLNDISVFTAVQDQLGLKLEPAKEMIEILVVDHWEKPSAN